MIKTGDSGEKTQTNDQVRNQKRKCADGSNQGKGVDMHMGKGIGENHGTSQ